MSTVAQAETSRTVEQAEGSRTEAQAEASRLNGARSRGPATPEGKARSRWNALRHGLAAERVVVLAEDAEEFAEYRQAFLDDLRPQGALEGALVERIALLHWRLRRAAWMEAGLVSLHQWWAHLRSCKWNNQDPGRQDKDWRPPERAAVGKILAENMTGPNCAYDTVGRYERRLERGLFQAIREWRELRRERGEGRGEREDAEKEEETAPATFSREPEASACPEDTETRGRGDAEGEDTERGEERGEKGDAERKEETAPAIPPAEVIAEELLGEEGVPTAAAASGAPGAPESAGEAPGTPEGI